MSKRTIKMWLGRNDYESDPQYMISLDPIKFNKYGDFKYSEYKVDLCKKGVMKLFGATLKTNEVVELTVTMSGKRVKP